MSTRTQSKFRVSEVALRLFIERGYENVTVDDVAAEAEVSRRTIFRYFGGKEELPFPDHEERRANLLRFFEESGDDEDPIEVLMAGTEATMQDFISRPDLILRRFELTRVVTQLAEREVIEHEKYAIQNRRFLRERLPADTPGFQFMAIAALTDSVHRATLNHWTRSGGTSDAIAELREGMDWVRGLLRGQRAPAASGQADAESFVAVLPHNEHTQALIESLRQMTDPARSS